MEDKGEIRSLLQQWNQLKRKDNKMRKFLKRTILGIPIISVIVLAAVVGGIAVVGASVNHYNLDKNIPSTVTVTASVITTPVDLYTDLSCTQSFSGNFDFGTLVAGGNPVTKVLYFKANSSQLHPLPAGYGIGEVAPSTIAVTNNIDPAVATFMYMVGEPFGSVINGNHPCMITFSVTPVGAGTTNFNIHVTGNDGTP